MSEYAGIEKPKDGASRVVGFTDAFTPGGITVQVRTMNMALDPAKPTQEESDDGPYETTALWRGIPEIEASIARYPTVLEAVGGHIDTVGVFEAGTLSVGVDERAVFRPRGGCGHIAQIYLPVVGETVASIRKRVHGIKRCYVCALVRSEGRAR